MMQLVQEKHGAEVKEKFLNGEATRLYNLYGDTLLDYFEPLLTGDQAKEFDQLVKNEEGQDLLISYLSNNIPNLEDQILKTLAAFRGSYLAGSFDRES